MITHRSYEHQKLIHCLTEYFQLIPGIHGFCICSLKLICNPQITGHSAFWIIHRKKKNRVS